MNIPNSLTMARIFFVPLLVAVLVKERILFHLNGAVITNDLVALMIFWVAAATDLLDGYLARRWQQVTTIGTLLDPIADKLLVSAALIALVQDRVVPAWLVVLLMGREFAVSGLRSIAASEGLHDQRERTGEDEDVFSGAGDFAAHDQHAAPAVCATGEIFRCIWWCCFPRGRRSLTSGGSGGRWMRRSNSGGVRNC